MSDVIARISGIAVTAASTRTVAASLQPFMNWLSTHYANYDGLFEIGELGDQVELFRCGCTALHDEALRFSAKICDGGILELPGRYECAADGFRWSQKIRNRRFEALIRSTVSHHCHNGGIGSFIGGLWVRFIH